MNRKDKIDIDQSFMLKGQDRFESSLQDLISKSETEPSPFAWERLEPLILQNNKWYHLKRVGGYCLYSGIALTVSLCVYFMYEKKEEVKETISPNSIEEVVKEKEILPPTTNIQKDKKEVVLVKDKSIKVESRKDSLVINEPEITEEREIAPVDSKVEKTDEEEVLHTKTAREKKDKKVVLKDSIFEYRQLFKKK